ncbi:peptidylprolyl isomerase [Shewanella sp. JM162201]|uniref:Peptidyl-prolyl cis-trans isomerase n=1 Tax=Shewanella jiangmenensis TaxID=2837387 RepID=A0ABS5V2J1_9GAMM|nr:peptidylprolyl isomerase [Shewanella jiangmenensis]MBT1444666.1 peptidylprolyl isomerase [Shewanella jiangmenensis]
MKRILSALLLLVGAHASAAAPDIQKDNLYPKVEMQTSMGTIVVELDRTRAPITVDNFLNYVVKGEYDNTIFHRVIAGFVVQGGGVGPKMDMKKDGKTIVNESGNGLSNAVGTIAMAREGDPHSATRQFYFNVADNTKLDPSPRRWGYAVFGNIVEGLDVVQAMSEVATGHNATLNWQDVPMAPIILKTAKLLPVK